jgi:hypothetical protein
MPSLLFLVDRSVQHPSLPLDFPSTANRHVASPSTITQCGANRTDARFHEVVSRRLCSALMFLLALNFSVCFGSEITMGVAQVSLPVSSFYRPYIGRVLYV